MVEKAERDKDDYDIYTYPTIIICDGKVCVSGCFYTQWHRNCWTHFDVTGGSSFLYLFGMYPRIKLKRVGESRFSGSTKSCHKKFWLSRRWTVIHES